MLGAHFPTHLLWDEEDLSGLLFSDTKGGAELSDITSRANKPQWRCKIGKHLGGELLAAGHSTQALRFPEVKIFLVLRPNSDDFSLGGGPQG